jgi:hypothetical protein
MEKRTKAAERAFIESIDLSTRKKRRQAAGLAAHFILLICHNEEAYQQRIPQNLRDGDAFAAAEETIEMLTFSIDFLTDAYE